MVGVYKSGRVDTNYSGWSKNLVRVATALVAAYILSVRKGMVLEPGKH